jgi:hypothetical protein
MNFDTETFSRRRSSRELSTTQVAGMVSNKITGGFSLKGNSIKGNQIIVLIILPLASLYISKKGKSKSTKREL